MLNFFIGFAFFEFGALCCRKPDRPEASTIVPFHHPQSCRCVILRQLPAMGGWRFCAFGAKVPQSTVSPMI